MNFLDTVLHDLVMLESDMVDAQKELKKLKKTNALQWVAIAYLVYRVSEKKENDSAIDKFDEKVHEKCKKIFNKKR